MKKIIAFSLWGNNTMYTHGVIENCKLAKTIYPDWVVWVYVDKTVPLDIIQGIEAEGGTAISMDYHNIHCNIHQKYGTITWINATWRFVPCLNNEVELFISRDADSRLSVREANLVNEWIASDKEFHIINLLNPTPIRKAGILLRKGNTYSKAADAFIKIVKTTL